MCRLFGFRSRVQSKAHRSLIQAENAIADQAQAHCDGWGIGYFVNNEPYVFKSAESASADSRFVTFSEQLHSQTILVHVRQATVGKKDSLNSHPFRYGTWMFAHNGTLFDFDQLKSRINTHIAPRFKSLIFGSTDSEQFFYFVLSAMIAEGINAEGRGYIDIEKAEQGQNKALSMIFSWCKELNIEPPKANYILTNGKCIFARRAGLELYFSTQKKFCSDALNCSEKNKTCLDGKMDNIMSYIKTDRHCNHVLISSEPIGNEDIWEEIPDGFLISVDDQFSLRLHKKPLPFWVTWPAVITRHPERKEVIKPSA